MRRVINGRRKKRGGGRGGEREKEREGSGKKTREKYRGERGLAKRRNIRFDLNWHLPLAEEIMAAAFFFFFLFYRTIECSLTYQASVVSPSTWCTGLFSIILPTIGNNNINGRRYPPAISFSNAAKHS